MALRSIRWRTLKKSLGHHSGEGSTSADSTDFWGVRAANYVPVIVLGILFARTTVWAIMAFGVGDFLIECSIGRKPPSLDALSRWFIRVTKVKPLL